jgi:hypothetical protein
MFIAGIVASGDKRLACLWVSTTSAINLHRFHDTGEKFIADINDTTDETVANTSARLHLKIT